MNLPRGTVKLVERECVLLLLAVDHRGRILLAVARDYDRVVHLDVV